MPSIADRVRTLRGKLSQADFAKRLHISRDYLSQIENGREPSARFIHQIELLEQVGLAKLPDADSVGTGVVEEDALDYDSVRHQFEKVIRLAGNNPSRIGWLKEQLTPPSHWNPEITRAHEKAIRDEVKKDGRKAPDQSSPPAKQGGAGR